MLTVIFRWLRSVSLAAKYDVTIDRMVGNMFADDFAGIAASRVALSGVDTDPVMFRFEHIRTIHLRLLAIATDIVTNFQREKSARPPRGQGRLLPPLPPRTLFSV